MIDPEPLHTTLPALWIVARNIDLSALPLILSTLPGAIVTSACDITPLVQFIAPLMISIPMIAPPFRSITAKAASEGTFTVPELITALSLAVGNLTKSQLVGLFQSLETAPVHVIVLAALTVSVTQLLVTAPKVLVTIT